MTTTGKGISSTYVRAENKRNVIRLLYKTPEGLTKQEIANRLGMSLPTAIKIVTGLRDRNLVRLQSSDLSSGGRIPEIAFFQYDTAFSFGVEITEHHIRVVMIDLRGTPLAVRYQRMLFENSSAYWAGVSVLVNEMLLQSGKQKKDVLGVGISIPGVVRQNSDIVEFAPTLNLRNFNFSGISEALGFPIIVENEANAAGFAEVWMQDSIRNAIYLSINKGVGGAIISNGNISYGENNRSGEFGHMVLIPYGQKCSCGKLGCVEAYCSTQQLTALSGDQLSSFFEMKKQRPDLQRHWEQYLDYLSIAISNICVAWDMPLILGGAITPYIEPDFLLLQEKVEKLIPFTSTSTFLELSKTGVNASAIGAALMIIARWLDLLQR